MLPLTSLAPLDTHSLSQRVERALLALIDSEGLSAGHRLPTENELAKQLGVSRATVREAIARLRADGVVSTKPGRGAILENRLPQTLRLTQLDAAASFSHLFELRRLIEIEAAGLAATRRSASDLAAIEQAYADMDAAAKAEQRAASADLRFHRAIAAGTGNPHLLALVDFIAGHLDKLIERAWDNSARHAGGPHQAQAEHLAVLQAIRAADPAAARRAARAHLRAAEARLLSTAR